MSETELDQDWAAVKLLPHRTGLPMAIWITENVGYQHDVRVKVSRLHSGRGSWADAVSVAVRPGPRLIPPWRLPADDLRLVSDWIELNRAVILDFWDGKIDIYEALPRLQKLP